MQGKRTGLAVDLKDFNQMPSDQELLGEIRWDLRSQCFLNWRGEW